MKTLLVMRHAKSSWSDESLDDFNRPLNGRGKRDAPVMAHWLIEQNLVPDQIVCSAAKRTRQTAKRVLSELPTSPPILDNEQFYHAAARTWMEAILQLEDQADSVLIIGHNPGLEELVSRLSGEWHRMPTAAIAYFEFDISAWEQASSENARLVEVVTPKGMRGESAP